MLLTLMRRSVLIAAIGMTSLSAHAMADAVKFNLPAGDLIEALKSLAKQADVEVMYSPEQLKQIHTRGVKGTYSSQEAIQILLKGTSLVVHTDATGAMVIALPPPAESTHSGSSTNAPSGDGNGSGDETTRSRLQLAQEAQGVSGGYSSLGGDENESSRQNEKIPRVDLEQVVVTGTHIRGVSPTSPLIVIDSEAISRSGYTTIGDVIRSVPQNFAGGNNPQVAVGNAPTAENANFSGGSSPNLRGLGPGSTLTLVNGHRLGQDGLYGAVDISLIPLAAIDRIEIVTDGGSAIYGSDAVAGVLNIVLKRDYSGAETSVLYGDSTDGGGSQRRVSQLLGGAWPTGSAMITFENNHQDAVLSNDRDFSSAVPAPSDLLPESSRNSFYTAIRQQVSDSLIGSIDGLYTSRSAHGIQTVDIPFTYYPPTTADNWVKQFAVNGGLTAKFAGQWEISATTSVAQQTNAASSVYLGAPPFGGTSQLQSSDRYRGRDESVEIIGNGPIAEFRGRTFRLAFGGEAREEQVTFNDLVGGATAGGSRHITSLFSELNAPILTSTGSDESPRLDFTTSGRYDRYSDAGNKFVPQFGLLFAPNRSLSLRSSWSRSFRAPRLSSVNGLQNLALITAADPLSSTGFSNVLVKDGADPNLRPETATTFSAGFDFQPVWIHGASLSMTYFNISYKDRIENLSVPDFLQNPAYAPLVMRNPSAALQQQLVTNVGDQFFNETGQPYDPATVAAIYDERDVNIGNEKVKGIDLIADYKVPVSPVSLDLFGNASYLQVIQQITSTASAPEIAGRAFNPPRFRARAGATVGVGNWSATSTLNFTGPFSNSYQPLAPHVPSWFVVDCQISYTAPWQGFLSGMRASLSVQNLFDKNPPYVFSDGEFIKGYNYDSVNATPLGRFVSLQLTKAWVGGTRDAR
jgi:iron complex outermembrane recepter protein